MAGEIQVRGNGPGRTLYADIHNRTAQIWSTSGGTGAFENFVSGNWASYAISLVEQGVSNFYVGTMPPAIPAGIYSVEARQQIGGSAEQVDPTIAMGDVQWNGTALTPLSDMVTSGQFSNIVPIKMARGVAVSGFMFYLKSAADHITPLTSGVCSGQVSRNGGAFGALQSGAFNEIGAGFFSVNLTSGDLNAGTVGLLFTGTGVSGGVSDPCPFSLVMQ